MYSVLLEDIADGILPTITECISFPNLLLHGIPTGTSCVPWSPVLPGATRVTDPSCSVQILFIAYIVASLKEKYKILNSRNNQSGDGIKLRQYDSKAHTPNPLQNRVSKGIQHRLNSYSKHSKDDCFGKIQSSLLCFSFTLIIIPYLKPF